MYFFELFENFSKNFQKPRTFGFFFQDFEYCSGLSPEKRWEPISTFLRNIWGIFFSFYWACVLLRAKITFVSFSNLSLIPINLGILGNLVNPVILVNLVISVNLLNLKKPVSLTNLVILVNIVNLVILVILMTLKILVNLAILVNLVILVSLVILVNLVNL